MIFSRVSNNPNQYELGRLILNICELTLDAAHHFLSKISHFQLKYPLEVVTYSVIISAV